MSQRNRQEYLKRILPRYQRAGRKHRQFILNEYGLSMLETVKGRLADRYLFSGNYSGAHARSGLAPEGSLG